MSSTLEREFMLRWQAVKGPPLQSEYRFHPDRRWRFDFACPKAKVAIEIEGGVWSGGRHTRGSGYNKDCEKYNEAAFAGWSVFRFTRETLRDWRTIERLALAIKCRSG